MCTSKSNRLHVDIVWIFFLDFEVYSLNSSKMIGDFPSLSSFNRLPLEHQPVVSRAPTGSLLDFNRLIRWLVVGSPYSFIAPPRRLSSVVPWVSFGALWCLMSQQKKSFELAAIKKSWFVYFVFVFCFVFFVFFCNMRTRQKQLPPQLLTSGMFHESFRSSVATLATAL